MYVYRKAPETDNHPFLLYIFNTTRSHSVKYLLVEPELKTPCY